MPPQYWHGMAKRLSKYLRAGRLKPSANKMLSSFLQTVSARQGPTSRLFQIIQALPCYLLGLT